MSRRLILDGYNIINAWTTLKALKDESLNLVRDEFIKLMSEYQAYTGDEVTIVFDGAKIEGRETREEEVFGLRIIFSKPPMTADAVIERLVYKDTTPSSIIVATSDSFLRNFALGVGASCCSPQNLEKEVDSALDQMRKTHLRSEDR